MRKPSLTADTFAAALALLAAGAAAGCSKAETSAAKPEPPSASAKTSEAKPGANTPTPPAVAATPSVSASGAAAGDAGVKPNSKASCGAGTCSADMKKGN